MRLGRFWCMAVLVAGCEDAGPKLPMTGGNPTNTTPIPKPSPKPTGPVDADGDGFDNTIDCDDMDKTIYPGAPDMPYDGIDSDCAQNSDFDADFDGYDSDDYGGDDCDDMNDQVFPGGVEVCDGNDGDCDGTIDSPLEEELSTWYPDDDGDTFGDSSQPVMACAAPLDHVADGTDCDDMDETTYPGAPDMPYDGIDSDCAQDSDFDADLDGYDSDAYGGDDCDDTNDQVFPGGLEVCDGNDGDCDGTVDNPLTPPVWYLDNDGDLFGDASQPVEACAAPLDYVADATDCDDNDVNTFPGAPTLVCDGSDNDCDPATFEPAQPVSLDGVDQPSLDAAVTAATAGSVIELCEGQHTVDGLTLIDAITIQGMGQPRSTVIEPVTSGTVITVATTEPVTLSRVRITGGTGTDVGNQRRGGGLLLADGSNVTLDAVQVEDNRAEYGAGLYVGDLSTLTIDDSSISDNDANLGTFGVGGGMLLGDEVDVTMANTTIANNFADFSCGGIEVGQDVVIDGSLSSVVANNEADLNGGGLCANFGVTISGVDFIGNEAISAGALYGTDFAVTDSLIAFNYGSVSTGGVLVLGTNVFERVTFDSNLGEIDIGGLQVDGSDGTAELIDSTVIRNTIDSALGDAGGVSLFAATLISTNTDWGDAGEENTPNDVWLQSSNLGFDATGVQSFTCDDELGVCL